jgi:hypothetical protein
LALAVYAADRRAALISHDAEFARRRRRNTIGRHIWLRCTEPQAPAVLNQHLAEVVDVLGRMSDVVIEVRPEASSSHHRDGSSESPQATLSRSWSTKWSTNWSRPMPVMSTSTPGMPEPRPQNLQITRKAGHYGSEVAGSSPAERAPSPQLSGSGRRKRVSVNDLGPRRYGHPPGVSLRHIQPTPAWEHPPHRSGYQIRVPQAPSATAALFGLRRGCPEPAWLASAHPVCSGIDVRANCSSTVMTVS